MCPTQILTTSDGSFAGDEVVAFGLSIGLDCDQVSTSRRYLPRLHFDSSERETSIELNSLVTQLSRLRDDGGQLFECGTAGSGVGSVFFGGLDARRNDGGLPADRGILALSCERPRVLHRFFRGRGFTFREQHPSEDAPGTGLVVAR